jgi:hypothetical protein
MKVAIATPNGSMVSQAVFGWLHNIWQVRSLRLRSWQPAGALHRAGLLAGARVEFQ